MTYRVCKYCGKETIGPVCPACIREGNEILHTDRICERLNNIYGTIGLFKFLITLTFVVSAIMVLCLNDQNLQHALAKVIVCIGSFGSLLISSWLRRAYNFKINNAIDRELKRRHNNK